MLLIDQNLPPNRPLPPGRATDAGGIGDHPAMDSSGQGVDLRIEGVAKRYGGTTALDSVDLHIASGELVALLGPSGSGKTTLLLMLGALLKPSEGTIRLNDVVLSAPA